MRRELAQKGITIPTMREFFFTRYADELAAVSPEHYTGILAARWWLLWRDYTDTVAQVRIDHGYPPAPFLQLDALRFSDELLIRLEMHRPKILSCWIIGGEVYDLDDLTKEEAWFHKGLDALEAMDADTIVSVVDVHY
jgi:hypothetical protein